MAPSAYFPAVGAGAAVIDPGPSGVRASAYCAVKVAVTFLAAFIVTLQVRLLPEQSPDHLVNTEPGSGVAVRVTSAPARYGPGVGTAEIDPGPSGVRTKAY